MHFVLLTAALLFGGDTGMNPERLARIPARMQAFVDRGTAAGFVTLVARHGQLASLAAVGYQDRESKTPMQTDKIFQIMSMSKPITGVGIMILVDDGSARVSREEVHDPRLDDAYVGHARRLSGSAGCDRG